MSSLVSSSVVRPRLMDQGTEQGFSAPVRFAVYLAAVLMLAVGWKGDFPLDDAYITMHNARALLQGWDATYAVSPLVGATSLVHLALMAGLGLVMPLPYAALIICLCAAMAYVTGMDLLVRRAGARGWQVPVLSLAALLSGSMPTLMANGLETSLACAAVTWLLLLDRKLPALAGIAPFVRPELAILAGLALIEKLWNASYSRRLTAIGLALAVSLPFIGWSYFTTGHVMPSTMSAKVAFFREGGWPVLRRIQALIDALVSSGFVILLPGFVGLRDWRAWGFMVPVVFVLVLSLPGAVDWNAARYLGPLVPLAILGYAQASQLRLTSFLIGLLGICLACMLPWRMANLNKDRAWNRAQTIAVQNSLKALKPGSRVLIHDAGIPAWVAPQMHLIDAVGLKTPSSIKAHTTMTRAACQWGRALDRIARSEHAQYALVLERPFWRCVRSNLSDLGWTFSPLPSHGSAYHLYAITPPQALDMGR